MKGLELYLKVWYGRGDPQPLTDDTPSEGKFLRLDYLETPFGIVLACLHNSTIFYKLVGREYEPSR